MAFGFHTFNNLKKTFTLPSSLKATSCVIGFLCLACISSAKSIEAAQDGIGPLPLRIAYMTENQPFSSTLPSGKPIGLYIDIWRLWSDVNGTAIVFVPTDTFAQNLDDFESGKVDFHAGLFINDERAEWSDFSLPIHKVDSGLFFHGDISNPQKLRELAGKRIAVSNGSFQHGYLKTNYPMLDIIASDQVSGLIEPLLNKNIDIIFFEIPAMNALLGRMGLKGALTLSDERLQSNTVHALIPKGHPELVANINQGLRAIPISKLIELEKRWMPEETPFFRQKQLINVPSLSSKQVDWISQHKDFSLGISPLLAPFETLSDDEGYSGISADYIHILKKKLAVNMTPALGLSWTQVVEQIKNAEIDILPTVVKTEQRSKFLHFTKPYLTFPLVIATHKNSGFVQGLSDLDGKSVGVEISTPAKELLQENHPGIKVVEVENAKQGMLLLQQRKIDAYVHNLGVIQYLLTGDVFDNIRVAAYTPYKLEIAMGVRKGLEPLVAILDQALETIGPKERASIVNNWLAIQVNVGIKTSTFLLYSAPILFILVLIILFFNRSNRRLQFEVMERIKVERSLKIARDNAQSANESKDEFLANMSHEIRTPMNAVLGMSYLLAESGLTEAQVQLNRTLSSSASSLLVVINDILDLSKIEAGKMEFELIPFNLRDIVKNVEAQIQFIVKKELVELSIDIPSKVPKNLTGDPVRVSQILLNLANNAAKFTHEGSIKISARTLSMNKKQVKIEIKVTDTGIGMTAEQQTNLFKTYSQADSSTTRNYGGTGLGLSISKKLCELMGGRIAVKSKKGVGSEFSFVLHFDYQIGDVNIDLTTEKQETPADVLAILKDKLVLIVDDNLINITIAETMLNKAGVKVITAEDGQLAIDAVKQNRFDAVLMDVQMPVMDGYQATQYIRQELSLTQLPIIALSANVMPSDVEKSLRVGMNGHIGKPLDVIVLLKTLSVHINDYRQTKK